MFYIKKEIEFIKYLLNEIENEIAYTENYKEAEDLAQQEAKNYNNSKLVSQYKKSWWDFLPEKYSRAPKKQFVKTRMRLIRELALKCYEA